MTNLQDTLNNNQPIDGYSIVYKGVTGVFVPTPLQIATVIPLVIPFSGGNLTFSAPGAEIDARALQLYFVVNGNFTSNLTINFNGNYGVWQIDTGSASLNGYSIILTNGTFTTSLTTSSIFTVSLPSANLITILAPITAAVNTLVIPTTGGAINLTSLQQANSSIALTGSLSSILTLTFLTPATSGYTVYLDCTDINYNSFYYIVVEINGHAASTHINASNVYQLYYAQSGYFNFIEFPNS